MITIGLAYMLASPQSRHPKIEKFGEKKIYVLIIK